MSRIEVSAHSPRRIWRMKTKYLFGIAAVAAAAGFTAQARAGWSVNLSLGFPVPPPAVVYRPPVVYSPAPVVVERPRYQVYQPGIIIRGHEHEAYRRDRDGRDWDHGHNRWDRDDHDRGRGGDYHDRGRQDHR